MEDQIIINLAYRNICFNNFFDNSLICYYITKNSLSKEQKFEEQFILKNLKNLDEYNNKKALEGDNSLKDITTKKNAIKEWSKYIKIKTSNNLTKNELETLLESIISTVLAKIKDSKNIDIVKVYFPEIIENIVSSFELLKKWKDLLKKQILEEETKNTNFLNDSIAKDKEFEAFKKQSKKEKIKLSLTINDLQKDKTNLNAQIDSLDKIIAELKNANNQLKMQYEEYSKNQVEYSQSNFSKKYYELKDLNYDLVSKNEIKEMENEDLTQRIKCLEENVGKLNTEKNELKIQVMSLIKENGNLKLDVSKLNTEKNELKIQVMSLIKENGNLKLDVSSLKEELKNERTDRQKFVEKFPDIVNEKIKELLKNWKSE